MCEAVIDNQISLSKARRKAYETQADYWKEDHAEVQQAWAFEDYLSENIRYWDHLCRQRDSLHEHSLKCDYDHSTHFEWIDKSISAFFENAKRAEIVLEFLEKKYGKIENSATFRQTLNEARLYSKIGEDFSNTRTPIADWD